MAEALLALTLWRPWPWSILYGPKRVENRPWKPPARIVGKYLALHAGKTWDDEGLGFIKDLVPDVPRSSDAHPLGIVGVVRVTGFRATTDLDPDEWAFGPYAWTLDEIVALPEPVPCKGAQGLWPVPLDVLARVREGYVRAKRAA